MHFFLFHANLLYWSVPGETEWGSAEEQPHKG